jgi:hypothetical protein
MTLGSRELKKTLQHRSSSSFNLFRKSSNAVSDRKRSPCPPYLSILPHFLAEQAFPPAWKNSRLKWSERFSDQAASHDR